MKMRILEIANVKTLKVAALTALVAFTQPAANAQGINDAIKSIEKHHFQKALSTLRAVMKNEPGNAAVYYHVGGIYLVNNMDDSARYFYEKGISVNGSEPLNYIGMGRYYLEMREQAKAKAQFEKALSLAGDKNAYVFQQVADAYVYGVVPEEGEWAVKLAEKAKNLDKKNVSYIVTLGDAWRLITGKSTDGLEQYKLALNMDKTYALTYFRMAQLYYKLNNQTEGDKFMNQTMSIDASFAPVYMDLAEQQADTRNYDKAIEYAKKYVELAGFAPKAQARLGTFYYYTKEYAEAIAELNKAAAYIPKHAIVNRLRAYSNYYLKNYKQGLEEIENYFKVVKPEYIIGQDYEHYGYLLQESGKDSLAIINFRKGLETDSTAFGIYDALAKTYEKRKEYLKAAEIMDAKLRVQKKKRYKVNPQDYYIVGRYYYFADNYALADTNFAQVNKDYPTWIPGFKYRAYVNVQLDKTPLADSALASPYWKKIIELGLADPEKNKKDLDDAYNYFAEYHYNRKEYGQVMCYANKMSALAVNPERAKKLLGYLPKGTSEKCPDMK
jgi:tetratricopeptide (TPR) repeat protein